MSTKNISCKVDVNQVLDCDSGKHSPSYGYYVEHNLFGNKVLMIRCGGCGKLQSTEHQLKIESKDYKPPIYNGVDWVYPNPYTNEYPEFEMVDIR